jgi:hypothetical protein
MKPCPQCGLGVSEKVPFCPTCGAAITPAHDIPEGEKGAESASLAPTAPSDSATSPPETPGTSVAATEPPDAGQPEQWTPTQWKQQRQWEQWQSQQGSPAAARPGGVVFLFGRVTVLVIGIGAAALVAGLAAFMPWYSVGIFSVAGTSGDGQITLGCAVLGLLMFIPFGRRVIWAFYPTEIVLAGIVTLVGLYHSSQDYATTGAVLTLLAGAVWGALALTALLVAVGRRSRDVMVVARFRPGTSLAGKNITYANGALTIEGSALILVHQLLELDAKGEIEWAHDGLREWAQQLAAATPAPQVVGTAPWGGATPAAGGAVQTGVWTPAAAPRRKGISGSQKRIIAYIAAGLAAIIVVIAVGSGALEKAGNGSSGGGTDTGPWVKVFSWSGGGASNDIRNSEPFTLEGGHQHFSFTVTPMTGESMDPTYDWTIEPVGGGLGGDTVSPSETSGVSDLYLDAGSYYVDCSTIDCTWEITITEQR